MFAFEALLEALIWSLLDACYEPEWRVFWRIEKDE